MSFGGNTMYSDLENRHVFITGGATGIGESIVRAFLQQGANVSFIDIDKPSAKALSSSFVST